MSGTMVVGKGSSHSKLVFYSMQHGEVECKCVHPWKAQVQWQFNIYTTG